MKIVFMGTPDFAVPSLKALCLSVFDICCVLNNQVMLKNGWM